MIELYQFAPAWGLPNPSPFCIKLELYLKMAGLPFEVITQNDTRKGPKGKIPFIRDDGQTIGDSELVIEYLKDKYGDRVDASLTAEQRARAHVINRMLHDSTYWVLLHCRWMEDNGYRAVDTIATRLGQSLDATAHAFILSFVGPPIDNPMRERIQRTANLMAYYQRMNQRFYPADPSRP